MIHRKLRPLAQKWAKLRLKLVDIYGIRLVILQTKILQIIVKILSIHITSILTIGYMIPPHSVPER